MRSAIASILVLLVFPALAQDVTEGRAETEAQTLRAERLIGSEVLNEQGYLADLVDLLINPDTGEVTHVLLSRSETLLDIDEEYVAVPFGALRFTDQGFLTLPLSVLDFQKAPQVEDAQIASSPDMLQEYEEWWQQVGE